MESCKKWPSLGGTPPRPPLLPCPIIAGEGNRTLVIGLEDRCSTIELHPRHGEKKGKSNPRDRRAAFLAFDLFHHTATEGGQTAVIGQSRIRTCVELSSPDLQSGAIGRSAICPLSTSTRFRRTAQPKATTPSDPQTSAWRGGMPPLADRHFSYAKLAVGLEPTTSGLQNQCSAIELRQRSLFRGKNNYR